MRCNFNFALTELLKHESGFVNHPSLDMVNKLPYKQAWLTHKNSHAALKLPCRKKAHHFTKRLLRRTQDRMGVVLKAVLTMLSLAAYAMRIISEKEKARICSPRCAIGGKTANAGSAANPSMEKVGGRSAKATTIKSGAISYVLCVSRRLVAVAPNAIENTRTMCMTSITLGICKKIFQSVMQLTRRACNLSPQKSQNACFYVPTATG